MLLLKADTQQQSDILFFVFPLKKEAKQISLSFGRLLRVKSILLDKTTDEAERIK
jgi:hypothetical protein|tara:strand:+ start:597 stop:761 length:165 start_codon:yes stop_codon:yes gene_type:complete